MSNLPLAIVCLENLIRSRQALNDAKRARNPEVLELATIAEQLAFEALLALDGSAPVPPPAPKLPLPAGPLSQAWWSGPATRRTGP